MPAAEFLGLMVFNMTNQDRQDTFFVRVLKALTIMFAIGSECLGLYLPLRAILDGSIMTAGVCIAIWIVANAFLYAILMDMHDVICERIAKEQDNVDNENDDLVVTGFNNKGDK